MLNRIIGYVGETPIISEFYRDRDKSIVRINRRRGGVNGIYRCVIPVSAGPPIVYQNIYIGVYTTTTGEWYMYTGVN